MKKSKERRDFHPITEGLFRGVFPVDAVSEASCQFLMDNPETRLAANAIVKELGLTATSIFEAFRGLGITPAALLYEIKIKLAAQALRAGHRVWEARSGVGISQAAMSERFWIYYGTTPKAYRRKYEQEWVV